MTYNFKSQEEREAFLKQLGDIHSDWSLKHAADEGVFDTADSDPHNPETGDTDYPIFYLDRSAPKETEDEFFDAVEKVRKSTSAPKPAEKTESE